MCLRIRHTPSLTGYVELYLDLFFAAMHGRCRTLAFKLSAHDPQSLHPPRSIFFQVGSGMGWLPPERVWLGGGEGGANVSRQLKICLFVSCQLSVQFWAICHLSVKWLLIIN